MKILNACQILVLILLIFSGSVVFAQNQSAEIPETIGEAKSFGEEIFKLLPNAVKKVWQEQAKPLWERTWVKWWNVYIKPFLQNTWQKITDFFGKTIKEQKPLIEQEFEKETQELKEEIKKEIPKAKKTIWERLKELIK